MLEAMTKIHDITRFIHIHREATLTDEKKCVCD